MKDNFSIRLKRERAKTALSQGEFSKLLNVARKTFQSWENGETEPDRETQKIILNKAKKIK